MAAAHLSKFVSHSCMCCSEETEGSEEANKHPAGAAYEGYVRGGQGADHGDTGVAGMPVSHATPLGAGASDDVPDPTPISVQEHELKYTAVSAALVMNDD